MTFPNPFLLSRRTALKTVASGFGYLAFAGMSTWAAEKDNPLAPKKTHFPAKAKHVIFLCMEGAPSHVDTFDYKPRLTSDDGKPMPQARAAFTKLMAPVSKFKQHGQSGMWVSELFPELAKRTDDLCLLNGMYTDVPAHPQAFAQLHTGLFQFRRPSMGAWVLYGLGTENDNLPGFVSINPPLQNGGPANYGSSFLPAIYGYAHRERTLETALYHERPQHQKPQANHRRPAAAAGLHPIAQPRGAWPRSA